MTLPNPARAAAVWNVEEAPASWAAASRCRAMRRNARRGSGSRAQRGRRARVRFGGRRLVCRAAAARRRRRRRGLVARDPRITGRTPQLVRRPGRRAGRAQWRQAPDKVDRGLERLGGNVVVGVTVREGEGAQAVRVAGGEDLGDGAARVVGYEVDRRQPQGIADVGQHIGQGAERRVVIGAGGATTVHRQIQAMARRPGRRPRSCATGTPWCRHLATGGGPVADGDVADLSGGCVNRGTVHVEVVELHVGNLPSVRVRRCRWSCRRRGSTWRSSSPEGGRVGGTRSGRCVLRRAARARGPGRPLRCGWWRRASRRCG